MKNLTNEHEYLFQRLKNAFDSFFELYCTRLKEGVPVKLFLQETQRNKVLMEEFKRYLNQRAEYECWEYKPENFEAVYVPAKDMPSRKRVWIANPLEENVVFEEKLPDFFIRLEQKDAGVMRDNLLTLLLKRSKPKGGKGA